MGREKVKEIRREGSWRSRNEEKGKIESGNGKQIHIEEEIMKQNEGIY